MYRRPTFTVLLSGISYLALAAAACGGSLMSPASTAAGFRYFYFDQPIQLDLDAGRVAVFREPGVADAGFPALGLAAGDIQATVVEGLSYASTPLASRSEAGIRNLVAALADEASVEWTSPVFLDERGDPVLITRHLNVGFHEGVDVQRAEGLLAAFVAGVTEARNYSGMEGVYRILCHSRNGFEVLQTANVLAQLPEVAFAEPDMFMKCYESFIPNDPYFYQLWGLHNTGQTGGIPDMDMDAPEAWDITTGDEGIIVVILDDGIQQDHPDLNQNPGADFTGQGTGGGPGNICDNHGTNVGGCTSAIINNSLGVVGVAPDCKIASAKWNISNVPCDGGGTFNTAWFINALNWAQTTGARVTNLSATFGYSSTIASKYSTTYSAGLVHFTSSGNDGSATIGFPGNINTVNAVGSVNHGGFRSTFSNYGSDIAVVAPGESIVTTDRTGALGDPGDYTTTQGTSFSSPYAAGVAALILSVDPTMTPSEVEQLIYDTCKDRGTTGWDTQYGWGIVQAYDAVNSIQVGPPNDNCADAEWFSEGIHQYTNVGATTDGPDEPINCTWLGYSQIDSDVWFRYWPGCTGYATIDVCNSNFNTKMAIYVGGCPTGPNQAIACDDNGCGLQSTVTFPVEQGTWYWVRIGGFNGDQGDGLVVVNCYPIVTCPADINGDNVVDVIDLLALLAAWGNTSGPEDINGDGIVDVLDLLELLSAWGPC